MNNFKQNDTGMFFPKPTNATCQDMFPNMRITLPPDFLNVICHKTSIGNTTIDIIFHSLCCQEPLVEGEQEVKPIDFYNHMCYSKNFTEFCNVVHFVPTEPSVWIITYLLLSLLTPLGILANFLIIFTVMQCKKLKTTTGYFLMNLAIADLLCILAMIAIQITETQINIRQNITVLTIFSSVDVAIGSASLLNVTAASVERAIAVTKPMFYPIILRKERTKKVIGIIWLYCFLLFIACSFRIVMKSEKYNSIIFYIAVSCSFFIPCLMVLISYINISLRALKNLKMEKRIERSMLAVAMLNERKSYSNQQSSRSNQQLVREFKLALNLTIMTVPFVFGWGFFMVGNIYEEVTKSMLSGIQNWFINYLPFLISCFNPVTYLLFTKTLRKEATKLLAKPFRKFRSLHERRVSSNSTLLTSTRYQRGSQCSEII